MTDPLSNEDIDGSRASQLVGRPREKGNFRRVLNAVPSFLAGAIVAIVIHYMLYRIGLPVQPFVYAAF